jgi:excisionase family DNA binding protein
MLAQEIAAIVAAELNRAAPKKDLYTIDDAAVYLACSPEQVRRFLSDKTLPCVKIDSRPRFRLKDLEAFVERSRE